MTAIVRKQKRKLLGFCLLLFAVLGLTACGNNVPENRVFSVDDMDGKVIGVQLGTTGDIYVSDMEGDEAGTKIERYNKGADAISSLKQGKLDCVVIDQQPAKAYVRQNTELMILDEEFTIEEYAAVIAKDNEELLREFNDALETLQNNGTLTKIINNYIPNELSGETEPFTYVSTVTDGEPLKMATNAQFPPYEYYEGGTIIGIDVDIARAAADIMGRTLVVTDMEFDSIINAVSSGKADIGLAGFTVTDERKKQLNFSDSYTTSKQVIIVRDNDAIKESQSFTGKLYNNFIKLSNSSKIHYLIFFN